MPLIQLLSMALFGCTAAPPAPPVPAPAEKGPAAPKATLHHGTITRGAALSFVPCGAQASLPDRGGVGWPDVPGLWNAAALSSPQPGCRDGAVGEREAVEPVLGGRVDPWQGTGDRLAHGLAVQDPPASDPGPLAIVALGLPAAWN